MSVVAIDSNALSHLIDACDFGYDPKSDEKNRANEIVSMIRIYLYGGEVFYASPTVHEEYEQIKDRRRKELHSNFSDRLLLEAILPINQKSIDDRIKSYVHLHDKRPDCKVVAEAEEMGMKYLLSTDKQLLKRLKDKTKQVMLMKPSEYWQALNVPKKEKVRISPHYSHPLSQVTWWQW